MVWLGPTASDSIAVSIYSLVRDGARRRPEHAAAMDATVRLRFADERYPAVRIVFGGDDIQVADDRDPQALCDLELNGRLGDIAALIAVPLAGGLPNPATSAGRRWRCARCARAEAQAQPANASRAARAPPRATSM